MAVQRIVLQWAGYVQKTYKTAPRQWADTMAATFARTKLANLERAASMRTYDTMMEALAEQATVHSFPTASAAAASADTGVGAQNLLYTLVTPCRLADTRTIARRIEANETRVFNATGYLSAQGGSTAAGADGCHIPTEAAAITVNIIAVSPAQTGYITVFPTGAARPLASSLNYRQGDVVGNEIIARLSSDGWETFSVYSNAATHVVIDVVGYFINPMLATAPLDCVQKQSPLVSVASGGTGIATTEACPTGYTATGGGCTSANAYPSAKGIYFFGFGPTTGQKYYCQARNQEPTTQSIRADLMCCRVP
ncbi:MAG TPA: hypothetical protein VGQ93_03280 [Lysobacter sp.]|nr:hypothetical protein [Lysobacter sp.]